MYSIEDLSLIEAGAETEGSLCLVASITVGVSIVPTESNFDYMLDAQEDIAYSLIRTAFIG
ncbi:MAG: hypothetical protein HDQ97_05445 [Lachnospiraceae bacterium]|nr:hypothetical protein [Lachnospiraceae bacterium]